MAKESDEFREKKKFLETVRENDEIKHKNKMEELTYERETNRLFHEWSLERGRIQRAEERRLMAEKDAYFRNRR